MSTTIRSDSSFKQFKIIVKYYLALALEKSGTQVNGDMYTEMEAAIEGLGDAIEEAITDAIVHHQDAWHGGEE